MMMTPIGPPVSEALMMRVEGLLTTAEYLSCLVEIVQDEARRLRGHMEKNGAALFADAGEWRTIETLLNLTSDQIGIVAQVAREVEAARIPVQI